MSHASVKDINRILPSGPETSYTVAPDDSTMLFASEALAAFTDFEPDEP
jgi:hypothetical protein